MRALFPFMLPFVESAPQLVGLTAAVQQGIGGGFTVIPSMGAYWRASVTFWVTNEPSVLAMQAFVAQMEGQLGTCVVPLGQRFGARDRDGRLLPSRFVAGLGGVSPYLGAGPESFEHFGFANAPVVLAVLREAADLRATRIAVDYLNSTGLRPGQYFSIADRLYLVKLAWQTDAGAMVEFNPPLRAAAEMGAVVTLDTTRCLMRFASEDEGVLSYSAQPSERVSVSFVEAI